MMYCVRCPRSRDCNKKGGYVKKGTDEETVRGGLWNHLTNSPYHEGLQPSQVRALVNNATVESWQEPWEEEGRPTRPRVAAAARLRAR